MTLLKKGQSEVKDILGRILRRDFSGNTGMAVKNSVYQFSANLFAKFGSLFFTIILARLLMPEMFGLYSLALSTILIFAVISELGLTRTLIRFISKESGKKKGNVKSYLIYFAKIKFCLIFVSAILLLVFAKPLADIFYQKPIFLALVAGALYIIFSQITGFLQSTLQASNNFKSVFKREVIFQVSRIILVPLAVVFALKYSLSEEINLMLIILFLAFSFFIASIFMFFDAKKSYSKYLEEKKSNLSKKQKTVANQFILATATLALSGIFFSKIDRVMLGRFVEAEFIGYYTAAFSLIGALVPLVGFAAIVLLPIFSKLKGKRLERGLNKSIRLTLLLAFAAFLATLILSYFVILIVYGSEYILSTNILRLLALLLFATPLIAIYQSYFISQGKPQKIAKLLIFITILNVVLNYIFITSLLPYGHLQATYGAAIATIISKFFYLGSLVFVRMKN